jgi:hypothetical protein
VVLEVVIRHQTLELRPMPVRSPFIAGAITALGTPVSMRNSRTGYDVKRAVIVVDKLLCNSISFCEIGIIVLTFGSQKFWWLKLSGHTGKAHES